MRMPGKTDWERVRHEIAENLPVPFDSDDEPYDPNDAEAVREAWAQGVVTVTERGKETSVEPEQVWLRVPPDVLEAYKVHGDGWEKRMDEALREGMRKPR